MTISFIMQTNYDSSIHIESCDGTDDILYNWTLVLLDVLFHYQDVDDKEHFQL